MQGAGVNTVLAAATAGELPSAVLASRLNELGAYRGLGRQNAIAQFSRNCLDALPKLFGTGAPIGEQLAEKLATHGLLLQCLSDCGALQHLHATTLRCLFEDGQRLAALAGVEQTESELQRGGGAGPLSALVAAAGQACMAAVAGSGERDPRAVFYSSPTATVAQFFKSVVGAVAGVGKQAGRAGADHQAVVMLSRAVTAALNGALHQRQAQQQLFPTALNAAVAGLDEPELAAGPDVRLALGALADACCRLQPRLRQEAPQLLQENVLLLFELADRLLNAGAAAVAAAPLGQQRRELHQEYAAVQQRLLSQLLQEAEALCERDEAEGQRELSRVQSLAEAHGGYATLFEIADYTGNRDQLHGEMQQLRGDGLTQPLATYVFERLLSDGRHAELMDLPQQFDEELHRWLADSAAPDAAQRLQLLWLHELRMHDYAGASATLGQLVEQAPEGEARRLAALQHLSALAAGGAA